MKPHNGHSAIDPTYVAPITAAQLMEALRVFPSTALIASKKDALGIYDHDGQQLAEINLRITNDDS